MSKDRVTPLSYENILLRQETIEAINHHQFLEDPEIFYSSIRKSKHPLMLTFYSLEELVTMQTFTLQNKNIGFALRAISEGVEIVDLHNNEPNIPSIGNYLVQVAISKGGNCLNHFGSEKLIELYQAAGFIEISREPFNPIYDPLGKFQQRYGPLPVIFRKLQY